ncbi:hypothetical protein [Lactococcus muris]|uniref:hypothetical protein n=1 Tax=Lactococcus muris TaxID=2941330 RepID=UPI002300478C
MNFSTLYKSIMNYGVYREAVHGKVLEPLPMFWNFISGILLDIPFQLFQIQALVVSFLSRLLNISEALKPVQTNVMIQAKAIFLGFIGGSNGTIAQASGAGMLLAITGFYLFYQYTNGKGNFMRAFVHLMAVVGTMFFFFGNFTVRTPEGQVKTEMGGQILFNTVTYVSDMAKKQVIHGMTGFSNTENSGDFIENYVVKPTANFINTGNPAGVIDSKTGERFDYAKAKGEGGQDYVDRISKKDDYLKNEGKQLGFQVAAGFMGGMNLWIYAVPIVVVNSTISALSLLVCVFVFFIPVSALLSFIPWFRNAFFTTVKSSLGLLVAPSLLSVMLGFLFFLMIQIDYGVLSFIIGKPQTNLEAAVSGLASIEFLIFLPVVFILKIVFMFFLWKSRSSLSQRMSGTDMATGNMELTHMKMEWENFKNSFKEKAEGVSKMALGTATENPELALDGALLLAPHLSKGFGPKHQAPSGEGSELEEVPQEEVTLEKEEGREEREEEIPEISLEDNILSDERQGKEEIPVQDLQDSSDRETLFATEERSEDEELVDSRDLMSWEEAFQDLEEMRA